MTDHLTLEEAIKAVIPHASKDGLLPMLNAVHITHDRVIATDRYTLARIMVTTGIPEGEHLTLDADTAKKGVKAISPAGFTPGTAEGLEYLVTFTDGSSKRTAGRQGDYPNLDCLIEQFTPAEPAHANPVSLGLQTAFLAKFAAKNFPKRRTTSIHALRLELDANPIKPYRVTFDSIPEYVALWVPVKIAK